MFGRKWSWPSWGYYPRICLVVVRKTTQKKKVSHNNLCDEGDSNTQPSEYKTEALPVEPAPRDLLLWLSSFQFIKFREKEMERILVLRCCSTAQSLFQECFVVLTKSPDKNINFNGDITEKVLTFQE